MTKTEDIVVAIAEELFSVGTTAEVMAKASSFVSRLKSDGYAITPIDGDSVIVPRTPSRAMIEEFYEKYIGGNISTQAFLDGWQAALDAAQRESEGME